MDRLTYLRQFYDLPAAAYEQLQAALKPKHFAKGNCLVAPGQIQREVYFIKKGVQMSYFEASEKTHVIAFTYPPNLCAIPESFSLQAPSPYYLSCLSDTEVDSLSFDRLQQLFDASPPIERLFRRMTEFVLVGMINRHIELHALGIEARYKVFCQRSPQLLQLVPHKYIASYLGIDPTNFSKLYNQVRI